MSNFQKDVQLLADLQGLIEKREKQVNPPEGSTAVRAMLRNGFELVEASSCVSPENYDEKLGREICMKKIKDRVWYLLGFLLQTAVNGVK